MLSTIECSWRTNSKNKHVKQRYIKSPDPKKQSKVKFNLLVVFKTFKARKTYFVIFFITVFIQTKEYFNKNTFINMANWSDALDSGCSLFEGAGSNPAVFSFFKKNLFTRTADHRFE